MNILKNKIFLILFILGCVIRFALAFMPGQVFDMQYWFEWSGKLTEVGFGNFYGSAERTDYMPAYLYILWLLGILNNIFSFDSQTFSFLLKIPGIISELVISALVYYLLKDFKLKFRLLATAAILLNPALIFNSAVWGQVDSILTLFMLLSVIFLSQKKFVLTSVFLSISFLIKPQTLSLIFLPILLLIKNFSPTVFLRLLVPSFFVIILISLPFFPDNTFLNLFNLLNSTTNQYSYNSLSAFNFWGLFGFWIDDNQTFFGLSFKNWGIFTFIFYWVIITYFYFTKKISVFTLASLATLGFFFLPTRVHERYLYPAIVFLVVTSIQNKNLKIFFLTLLLSFIHFLNLLYVYTMYNPESSKQIYQFLEKNTTLLTIVSCGLFIIIVYQLIKNNPNGNT